MKKILTIFGTRPEAIKLAPIILLLRRVTGIESRVCVTAQHREMLDQVLCLFDIQPDIDLNLMTPGQSLAGITSRVIKSIDEVLESEKPDAVIVQGDTTTVMATALAAFYRRITIGHVEAGLRSWDIYSPFPEEANRRIAGLVSQLHFAPTQKAVHALRQEGIAEEHIFLTGNPVIDALQIIVNRPEPKEATELLRQMGIRENNDNKKLILVTAHRRENFGERFENLCLGLRTIAERNADVVLIYPVHLNPIVQETVYRVLSGHERILLTKPVEYDVLAHLMKAAYLILTDSGGIQEEAPSLGKPVLVMRTETERPEGIATGTAKLVGPYKKRIVDETEILLRNKAAYQQMVQSINPYGDGHAAERIVKILKQFLLYTDPVTTDVSVTNVLAAYSTQKK